MKKLQLTEYINRCSELHNYKYDYSRWKPENSRDDTTPVICKIHGEFFISYKRHIKNSGCPKCSDKYQRTLEERLIKAVEIHGDNYDYSKWKPNESGEKFPITCNNHKEPYTFLRSYNELVNKKRGCPKCSLGYPFMIEERIEKANIIHNNKYNYSEWYPINSDDNSTPIICHNHEEPYKFYKSYDAHVNHKIGCDICLNKKEFDIFYYLETVKTKYPAYDYSEWNPKNSNDTSTPVICKKHSVEFKFYPHPYRHVFGKSKCPICYPSSIKTIEQHIFSANEIHKYKFDYSLWKPKNSRDNSTPIICHNHEEPYYFYCTPSYHNISDCPKCSNNLPLTLEEKISNFENIHGVGRYDYSGWKNDNDVIICNNHDIPFEFYPSYNNHYSKATGCPKCHRFTKSKGEKEIAKYLELNNIEYVSDKVFDTCKRIKHLRFDFYLPSYNLCIEYNGKQHYYPIKYFGGVDNFNKQQMNDMFKYYYCLENHINLLVIDYFDYKNISKIINSHILNLK